MPSPNTDDISNDVHFQWGNSGDICLSGEALPNAGQYKLVYKGKLTAILYNQGHKAGVAILKDSPLGSGIPGVRDPHKEINELYLNRHFFGKDDLTVQAFFNWAVERSVRTNPQSIPCTYDPDKSCDTFLTNAERIQVNERSIMHVEYSQATSVNGWLEVSFSPIKLLRTKLLALFHYR